MEPYRKLEGRLGPKPLQGDAYREGQWCVSGSVRGTFLCGRGWKFVYVREALAEPSDMEGEDAYVCTWRYLRYGGGKSFVCIRGSICTLPEVGRYSAAGEAGRRNG